MKRLLILAILILATSYFAYFKKPYETVKENEIETNSYRAPSENREVLLKPTAEDLVTPPIVIEKTKKSSDEAAFVKSFRWAEKININLSSWVAHAQAKKDINLAIGTSEKATIKIDSARQYGKAIVFEGIMATNMQTKGKPFILTISGDYVEGGVAGKTGYYQILTGPNGTYLAKR